MTPITTIHSIYEELRKAYEPITRELMEKICTGEIVMPTGVAVFPAAPDMPIEAQNIEAGFLTRDCATLTAFRATRTLPGNRIVNGRLRAEMQAQNMDFFAVDGCYREARESEPSVEDSFFVYDDGTHNARDFFTQVYQLSEKYKQDCFLYKSAGINRVAFLISTNDDARQQMGNVKLAGRLYLNLEPVGPYTIIGATCVRFEENDPVI